MKYSCKYGWLQITLLAFMILLPPATANAHGGEVLFNLFILEVVIGITFGLILLWCTSSLKLWAILTGIYFVLHCLGWLSLSKIGDVFAKDSGILSLLMFPAIVYCVPILLTALAWFKLRKLVL